MSKLCKTCGRTKGEPEHRRVFRLGRHRWECKLVPVTRDGRTVWIHEDRALASDGLQPRP